MEELIRDRIHHMTTPSRRLGAHYVPGEGCYTRIWAPYAKTLDIVWNDAAPLALHKEDNGYYTGFFPDTKPGDRYFYMMNGQKIPDPASRFQPLGVFGPSQVVAQDYPWTDHGWKGVPFHEWVIYEIHTGCFSPHHNFQGIIDDLPRLKELGVTILEIMPVSQFSGERNWGYDGVFPHAVQNSYGGPDGLKALVNACHEQGLGIILDVVYNHIGPEGNVLFSCGPYVGDKYKTPWGKALNYDGRDSEEVRRYFLQSAWQWLTEYHFDGLRLDAIQMIFDNSPIPFLQELSCLKRAAEDYAGRKLALIAETDMNDSRILVPLHKNGFALDGQWADDLHHNLHALMTGERDGYYYDYGTLEQMEKIYRDGVAFTGEYSPYRKRCHGRSYDGVDKKSLVVSAQNHDQIGNRLAGDRLSTLIDFDRLKLSAACIFLSPFMPLMFMGEEFACKQPFPFFVSHSDRELLEAIRKGRAHEWKDFDHQGEPPDPAALSTFECGVLKDKNFPPNTKPAIIQGYYRDLIALSKRLRSYQFDSAEFQENTGAIILKYSSDHYITVVILRFHGEKNIVCSDQGIKWNCLLHSGSYRTDQTHPPALLEIPPYTAIVLRGDRNEIESQNLHSLPFLSTAP